MIAFEFGIKKFRREHVDAHAGEHAVGFARHRRRTARFFLEIDNPHRFVDRHHPEIRGLLKRHLDAGDGAVGTFGDMVGQHVRVIHLVDVVAGQDDKVFRAGGAEDVEVLEHGVGGAAIPGRLVEPLLRRQQVEKFAHFRAQKRPAHLQMAQQAVRLVLGQDGNAAHTRIEAVRQGEVDDPELAAKKNRGLGAAVGQLLEAAAASAGENKAERLPRQPLLNARVRQHVPLPSARPPRRAAIARLALPANARHSPHQRCHHQRFALTASRVNPGCGTLGSGAGIWREKYHRRASRPRRPLLRRRRGFFRLPRAASRG